MDNNNKLEPTKQQLQQILRIKQELHRRQAFDSFEKFLLYVNPKFWSVRLLVKEFRDAVKDAQRLAEGYIDFLMISLPAGFGKSYLRECWNAWVVGRDVNNTVLVGTYSDSIAKSFTRYFMNIITDDKFVEVFGAMKTEVKTQNEVRLKGTTLPYTYFVRGANASVTGNRAKYIQVDDIIKDFEESQSSLIKQKRWDWYSTTLKTRKADETLKEFWCGTRWAKDDPMGRKIDELDTAMSKGLQKPYKVKIHAIPALITIDKKEVSICESWTTTEELLKIKSELTDRPEVWEALYQQHPIDSIGALFPESKMQTFSTTDILEKEMGQYGEVDTYLKQPDRYNCFTICDVADEGKDFHSVVVIAYDLKQNEFLLVDVVFTQDTVDVTAPEHARMIVKYKSVLNRIEKNNFGKAYSKDVTKYVGNKGNGHIKLVTTKMNKNQKIYLWSDFIMKTIKFRDDWKVLPESHKYKRFMKQLISYDKSGKNDHDDAADTLAMTAQTISQQFNITNATVKAFNKASQSKIKELER